ncbi:MAG TPA: UMP kinase [Acholeplasmataceae bacterium]|nr:MAG: UMP kinase [Tenericutes bacterium GWA2_38_26]OHE31004.1 MAG: UMP kinase [Tenericutes bacterium GWC2_39_45]OHE32315.1 MAG: UMP kinase [Tenericutes bacterium GWD2_38_27]OHE40235.1 MAG: UMP kinase [Tenericutes bacterium GWE2_38_8]OHE40859.1 MAG: UMP kinase [Tenericutes bacterium GWF2_38_8]HBG32653.1 UMP kinase [Acholeplasmataceae bacterium]
MYQRVILKLSGEALKGNGTYGINPATVKNIATEIKEIYELGVQIGIVVGAGNLWRGKTGEELGMDRAQADYMGMLGTIMNGLALQDALESAMVPTRVMTVLPVSAVAEPYIRRRAMRHFEKGRVLIFSGGTGSPFFSTDTAAALRAAELNADIILMAKNGVEGVYDMDPRKHSDAVMYHTVTQQMVLEKNLQVMDQTAASICRENKINILVFNMNLHGNIKRAVMQEQIGTLVKWEE